MQSEILAVTGRTNWNGRNRKTLRLLVRSIGHRMHYNKNKPQVADK